MAKPRDARREKRGRQLAPSVTRVCILARFARRTKTKERLLVVYFVITICTSLQRQLFRPINACYFYTDISAEVLMEILVETREELLTAGYQ